jgi:uncharacterized protein (TIGR03382 family)
MPCTDRLPLRLNQYRRTTLPSGNAEQKEKRFNNPGILALGLLRLLAGGSRRRVEQLSSPSEA